jgi:hypothetical protein
MTALEGVADMGYNSEIPKLRRERKAVFYRSMSNWGHY